MKRQSEHQRAQLFAVSHDILQPLQSLRTGLKSLNIKDEDAIQNMHDAFDYLETLARNSLSQPASLKDVTASGVEDFSLKTVTDVAYAMFKEDAAASDIELRYSPNDTMVQSEPVALMRILNNALANALKHADASVIEIRTEESDLAIQLIISDDGRGMTEEQATKALELRSKGEASDGHGLGLTLISEECDRLGLLFAIQSHTGQGTTIFIGFPKG